MSDKPQTTPVHWSIFQEPNCTALQFEGIQRLVEFCRSNGGAHTIDVIVRKDGRDHRFEADWIKHMEKFNER